MGGGYQTSDSKRTTCKESSSIAMSMRNVKCVCIGDGAVGKTCLLMSYSQDRFPTEYVPTIFDNFAVNQEVDGIGPVCLNLWDTAGQEDYDELRRLSYPESEVILMCFSINSPTSLANVKHKWSVEAKDYCPEAPVILIGLQADRRKDDNAMELLKQSDGYQTQREIGAYKYMEVSALTMEGVKELFLEAIKVAVHGQGTDKKKSCCTLL
ncbi:ras-related protein ced-10-like [Bolinopsis microptera]|uniref:ras-related protein ced-10-like n=1 Tax=Bolinopsis microptera TaxID=2820187 RepID=UPI003078BEDC